MTEKQITAPAPPPPKQIVRRSVQDEPISIDQGPGGGNSFVIWMASISDAFTQWGTNVNRRDRELRDWWPTETVLSGAIYTVTAANAGFKWELEGPPSTTARVQKLLQHADAASGGGSGGWRQFIQKISVDLYTQDNGAFIEVIRERNSPKAPIIGIAHLEALKCQRTGDVMTPVIHTDRHGNRHKMPWYSIIALAEMPSSITTMLGVQYCAVTRVLRAAQIMRDIAIFRGEKVGGRFTEAVHIVGGVKAQDIQDIRDRAQERADNAGLARYMAPVIVASLDPQATPSVATLDMKSLPESFDLDSELRWYIAMIALGLGRDYQEFAPLPGRGLGTGAQSEVQHLKARGKGPAAFMEMITHAMNAFVMPRNVTFKFSVQDVDLDKQLAENSKLRAESRAVRINSGELDPIIARQIAQDDKDLDIRFLELLGEADLTPDMLLEEGDKPESEGPVREEDEKAIVQVEERASLAGLMETLLMDAWASGTEGPPKERFRENIYTISLADKMDDLKDVLEKIGDAAVAQGEATARQNEQIRDEKAHVVSLTGKVEDIQDALGEVIEADTEQRKYNQTAIKNMHVALKKIENAEPMQVVVPKKVTKKITDEVIRAVAAHATSLNLGASVVQQEVVSRDKDGLMKVIRKKLKSGETVDYEVTGRDEESRIQKIRIVE